MEDTTPPTIAPPSSKGIPTRWIKAIVSFFIFIFLGGLVGAYAGEAFMLLFFTFWFITFSFVTIVMGILFWLMLIKSIRFFCFIALIDICLFFLGIALGMGATGK